MDLRTPRGLRDERKALAWPHGQGPWTPRARTPDSTVCGTCGPGHIHPDPNVHTFNRYGVQFGTKVPLWGGFTGGGQFTLRLWTPRPKMLKGDWEAKVPQLKRAVDVAETRASERSTQRAKVWYDNEKFLLCPETYTKHGLEQVRFPPNSGDLNPIETVWAELRKDLAAREQEDLSAGRVLTLAQSQAACGADLERLLLAQAGPGAQLPLETRPRDAETLGEVQGEEVRQVWEVSWVGVVARLSTANVSPCKGG